MALTYLGTAAQQQRGVELAETGISVASYSVQFSPEVNERRQNNLGETDGRVVSTVCSRVITIEGEVTGTTGVMAYTFLAAVTPANDILAAGWLASGGGGLYMHEVTESQARADWRKVSIRLESNPGLS